MAVFATTGVCLPWISLMFAAVVLGLGQIQRLGEHPVLFRVVQPVLTAAAVAATLLKLLLLRAEHNRAGHMSLDPDADNAVTNLPYVSGKSLATCGKHRCSRRSALILTAHRRSPPLQTM